MKKKVLIVGLTSIFALGISAVAVLCSKGKVADFKATDSYTITIDAKDITNATSWDSGTFVVKTDQLKNDVTLSFENVCATEGGVYLQGNGYGRIFNTIGHEVRGIESIYLRSANQRNNIRYGFRQSGSIKYIDYESAVVDNSGYEFSLNGVQPNYFSIESGQTTDVFISEIVITYPSECVEHENPYKVINDVKYFRSGDEYLVQGFDNVPVSNVVLVDHIDGYPVTDILGYAFNDQTTIQSVNIPYTIEAIGCDAFRDCTNLTTVTFETGGTEDLSIFDGVFRNTGVTSLVLPKRVDYIEPVYALYDMFNLTSISIEDDYSGGNYKTDDGVLYKNEEYAGQGVQLIHYPAKSPYPVFNVPTDVTKISDYSCQNTVNLKTVIFNNPDDLLIENYAFGNDSDVSSIENIYFQGAGQVTINWNPFRGYQGDMILHDDTIILPAGLGQMNGNARVFLEATEIGGSWDPDWASRKDITYGSNVKFYLYSENSPVNPAPTDIDGFWHYVNDEPTVW